MAVKESKLFKISFVNAYTPMKVKSDEEWEEFYQLLDELTWRKIVNS